MKKIRKQEVSEAGSAINAKVKTYDFGDTKLLFKTDKEVYRAVLSYVRKKEFGAIFSFDPREITYEFDHPDHTVAGTIARSVSSFADVKWHRTQSSAMQTRPDLFLWTTDASRATHRILLPRDSRERRNQHLLIHVSQFHGENQAEWENIFDTINQVRDGIGYEYWVQVRGRS